MTRKHRMWTALVVGACMGLPGGASAGPIVNLAQPCDCPPTHYSAMHVATPIFYRWAAWCRGPARYTYAELRHPDIAPNFNVNAYHCPSVNPLQYSLNHHLGLGSPPPCSEYPSPPPSEPSRTPPELLPPPKEEKEKKGANPSPPPRGRGAQAQR